MCSHTAGMMLSMVSETEETDDDWKKNLLQMKNFGGRLGWFMLFSYLCSKVNRLTSIFVERYTLLFIYNEK